MRRLGVIVLVAGASIFLAGCQHQQDAGAVVLRSVSNAMHSASVVGLMGGLSTGDMKMAAAGLGAAAVSAAASQQADRIVDQQQMARLQGGGAGAGSRNGIVGTRDGLPDTPACRRYNRMIKRAGWTISASEIVSAYQACMRSAPNHPYARRNECAPGKYRVYIRGQGYTCGTGGARVLDAQMAAHNLGLLLR